MTTDLPDARTGPPAGPDAATGQAGKDPARAPGPGANADGSLRSDDYAQRAGGLVDRITPRTLQINYTHPLERWLSARPIRWLLDRLARVRPSAPPGRQTPLERIFDSYRNPDAPLAERLLHAPVHVLIDRFRGDTPVETFRRRLVEHTPTLRGLVVVARSVAEFGLTVPQTFSAPLFAVWNFTNACNLACRHCYQHSDANTLAGELTSEEKLDLIDQMGDAHMPMLAFSGGEPTLSPDLIPCLRRAGRYGMHTTIATNGTTMTPRQAGRLAEAGLRYVEISLDSIDPKRHDAFRGVEGIWRRSVEGARTVVATEGLRLGIAMCVHRGNVDEVEEMIDFAEDLGASCFAHFNFIPVGRGLDMAGDDIPPRRREQLLAMLNERMQRGGIGVISTAPQLGRVCLAGSPLETGRTACSHAGSGSGVKARVVAKYLGGCGAGRTYVCIEPDGDVTPCVYMPDRVMGNVRDRPLVEIYRDNPLRDVLNDRSRREHHCRVCSFSAYCGGCRARADAYFADVGSGDPGCVFNDRHWETIVGIAGTEADR
jgi:radical SAM protein with 4Fe4S-binding SPASM domain